MIDPESLDQPVGTPTFQSTEITHQHQDGLLSRPEAEVFDILMTQGVFSAFNASYSDGGRGLSERSAGPHQSVLISHIHLRCLWVAIPSLRQWISHFLTPRQPDASVVASGMVKRGNATIAIDSEHDAIEGFLVIGSLLQDLHGTLAEQVVAHLVAEGQITCYSIYTIGVDISFCGMPS